MSDLDNSAQVQNLKKIQFWLVKTPLNRWYWTVYIPGQLVKFSSKDEAAKKLGAILRKLMNGSFEVVESDTSNGKQRFIPGSYKHLIQMLEATPKKKKKKKKKGKKHG